MVSPMGKPKRQEIQGKIVPSERPAPALFVGATPIGNLGDVTARVRQELGSGRTILCEDTRRTLELCRAFGIEAPGRLERCDEHSRESQVAAWVKRAQAGELFLLVTDAGTPSISDPGASVVSQFVEHGLIVEALPGPSAVPTALSIGGFEETAYLFWGFFPRSAKEQREAWEKATRAAEQGVRVHCWFESPERVLKTLSAAIEYPGAESVRVVALRELTKRFETTYRGSVAEVARQLQAADLRGELRGEWVLLLQWPKQEKAESATKDWEIPLKIALRAGATTAAAAREVSAEYGLDRSQVYDRAVHIKKSSSGD